MSWQEATASTPDGASIAYRVRWGRDPIVLLHALGCDGSMWDGVVESLPADMGVIVPELRGHGGSTLGWRAPSVDLWADDVVRLLDLLGIVEPSCAGLSMGGYVAFALEASHRGRVRSYAFISTAATADDEAGRQRRAAGIATIGRRGWKAYAEGMITSLLNEDGEGFSRHSAHVIRMMKRAGDSGLPAALMALAARPDRLAALMGIEAPCIAVVGSADVVTPPDRAREIAAAIPGARLHVLAGAAHLSALERPREIAGLVGSL
jgi:pimeloyl-ACP methyl ester carboxylesterase